MPPRLCMVSHGLTAAPDAAATTNGPPHHPVTSPATTIADPMPISARERIKPLAYSAPRPSGRATGTAIIRPTAAARPSVWAATTHENATAGENPNDAMHATRTM